MQDKESHGKPIEDLVSGFQTHLDQGLTQQEARERLAKYGDSIAIMFIVVLNAVVGVVQESKAEQALAALKKMSAPNAQVIRDGHQLTIPGRELVPGDIVLLEAGNYIPADMRLVTAVNLKVEEASLTGES